MDKHKIPEKFIKFIQEETAKADYELVDIITRGGGKFFIECVLDKKGGITLEECSSFNRKVMSWIEKEKIFIQEYVLDVCSPGLDRELRTENAFSWARGKQIEVRVRKGASAIDTITGKLIEKNSNGDIVLELADKKVFCIDKKDVIKTKLKVVM